MKKIFLTLMTMIVCLSIDAQVIKVYQNGACTKTYTNTPTNKVKVVMNDNTDLLPGLFSISATSAVEFAKGNLYWDGSAYKIEDNQTDYPTSWDANHVGHFFWTSLADYQLGTAQYMPYAEQFDKHYTSILGIDFWCGEDTPIAFGDDDKLYALNNVEWIYLLNTRNNATSLHTTATVTNGGNTYQNCLILAPDNYAGTLKSSYTLDKINSEGLVCLPAAGYRNGSTLSDCGSGFYYWTAEVTLSSASDEYDEYNAVYFTGNAVKSKLRSTGMAMRLVKKIQKTATTSSFAVATHSLKVGETYTQTVNTNSDGAATYSSSDTNIATVNSKTGEVTAVAEGTAVITATVAGSSNYALTSASYTITVAHEYVDLGLSVNWARCNIGADKPEDYGPYFAWGETTGYTSDTTDGRTFDWTGYNLCEGTNTSMKRYCTNTMYGSKDEKTTLESTDDAAHVNWGLDWRMPTNDECTELKLNCYWEYTDTYKGASVPGYIVYKAKYDADKGICKLSDGTYKYINTSLTATPTLTGTYSTSDTHIFLPASGFRCEGEMYNLGTEGYYWSSSLNAYDNIDAYDFYFTSSTVADSHSSRRYCGQCIRAVIKKTSVTVSFAESSKTLTWGDTYTQTATTTSGLPITYTSSDPAIATVDATTGEVTAVGEGTVTITAIVSTIDYYGSATYTITVNHAYVDLGLSVNWARCNIGAKNPQTYGLYFAWGETTGYTTDTTDGRSFSWAKYYLCEGTSTTMDGYCTDTRYGNKDDITTLRSRDDAAYVNWGVDWRMPTNDEFTELKMNCYWEYTDTYNSSSVPGYIVYKAKYDSDKGISKLSDGTCVYLGTTTAATVTGTYTTDDTHIFFPIAGYRQDSDYKNSGYRGDYWSSSVHQTGCDNAYELQFAPNDVSKSSSAARYYGFPVRAVFPKTVVSASFSEESKDLGLGETFTQTVQTDCSDAFTYTSSDPSVATVDATTGKVTAVSRGTVTITATLLTKEKYGIATYTVTVLEIYPGRFSVGDTKQVQFTKGNLYWDGSAFKFEDNQTDSPTSWDASHVGHFFWTNATDYNSGTASYMPYAETYAYSTQSTSDKLWCGENNAMTIDDLSGLYCMTTKEWEYLRDSRENASSLYKGSVTVTNGSTSYTNCVVIAPDDYDFTNNPLKSSYTLDEIKALGLVCLPTTGHRLETTISQETTLKGKYNVNTPHGEASKAWAMTTYSGIYTNVIYSRYYGQAIRLVREYPRADASVSVAEASKILNMGETYNIAATAASEGTITYTSSNPSVATVDETGKVTALAGGTTTITATVSNKDVYGSASCEVTVLQYVDLGLSVKWASFNVGAIAPEERGLYFSWADTAGYAYGSGHDFNWWNYKYCEYDETHKLTKYNSDPEWGTMYYVDDLDKLEAVDDAASVNWGNNWHVPSKSEWTELINNCTWTYTTVNGMPGYKVTGSNGNSIFLPAARSYNGTSLEETECGVYWTNEAYTSAVAAFAYVAKFNAGENMQITDESTSPDRCVGNTIRAVRSYTAASVSFTESSKTLSAGDTYTLAATTTSGLPITYTSSNTSVATVDASTGEVTAVAEGTATITATVSTIDYYGSATYTITVNHEYVDLGLSVNWAKCNIGAENPQSFGLYFAWGETTGYTTDKNDGHSFDWTNYKYCKGTSTTLTKYNTSSSYGDVDNKTTLELVDDAANVNWGGDWRMPTNDQLTELKLNCYWEYTSSYNNTGMPGYIVYKVKDAADKGISKIAAGTYQYINTALTTTPTLTGTYSISDTHIFLPMVGYRKGTEIYSNGTTKADYWTSSILSTTEPDKARSQYFGTERIHLTDGIERYYGFQVRAVTEKDIVTVSFDKSSKTLTLGDTYTQTATTDSSLPITYTSSNTAVATVDATTGKVTPLTEGTATITAIISTEDTYGTASYTVTVHEYVDLGLSTNWAICNVGTDKPEGYGLYYSWGETTGYSASDGHNFAWSTYKWCNGSETTLTKYCTSSKYGTVDGKTTLELADDAANYNWGGDWRMPSPAEWTELFDNCTWTYTSVNSTPGYKVTGPNGNSIFLPASKSINGTTQTPEERGIYWTNEAVENTQYAYFTEYSANAEMTIHTNGWHFSGHTVRAVIPKTPVTVSFTESSKTLTLGDTYTQTATTTNGLPITYASSNTSVATVDAATGKVTAVAPGTATITASVSSIDFYGSATYTITVNPEYVDLGLSVKWATCNLGAVNPEDYGLYYAWGETTGYSSDSGHDFSWANYKWCNGTQTTLTKYCRNSACGTADYKNTLELEDDAASVNWGGSWRMPTAQEQQELINKCTWTISTLNGVKGFTFTGPNGNSIFIPNSGGYYETTISDVTTKFQLWSSTLYKYDTTDAYESRSAFYLEGSTTSSYVRGYSNYYARRRNCGQPIRAVCP